MVTGIMRRPDGVFVSSVYNELKPYRKAALDAVWHARLYPIGMEREDIARPGTTTRRLRARCWMRRRSMWASLPSAMAR